MGAAVRAVAAPFLRARIRPVAELEVLLPRPTGVPQVHSSGTDHDRVLVAGGGAAVGWGVRSHDLALPGQLARALSVATGRGSLVDVAAVPGITIEGLIAQLRTRDLTSHDAVVVAIGVADAARLIPERRWRQAVEALVETIEQVASASTELVVVGIQPLSSAPGLDVAVGGLADRWAAHLNTVTRAVLAEQQLASYVAPPEVEHEIAPDDHRSTDFYRAYALAVASPLALLLTRHAEEADRGLAPSRAARMQPQAVERRLADETALRLLGSGSDVRLDRVVEHARSLFGTASAAFTVLDDDRQRNVARSGQPLLEIPLAESICRTTIRATRAHVVSSSSSGETLLPGSPLRFYAGYPVESPDGVRIGALCVFDTEPRDLASIDVDLLRDLAMSIQQQLWAGGGERLDDAESELPAA